MQWYTSSGSLTVTLYPLSNMTLSQHYCLVTKECMAPMNTELATRKSYIFPTHQETGGKAMDSCALDLPLG